MQQSREKLAFSSDLRSRSLIRLDSVETERCLIIQQNLNHTIVVVLFTRCIHCTQIFMAQMPDVVNNSPAWPQTPRLEYYLWAKHTSRCIWLWSLSLYILNSMYWQHDRCVLQLAGSKYSPGDMTAIPMVEFRNRDTARVQDGKRYIRSKQYFDNYLIGQI